jgi:hypothetical protein
MRTFGMRDAGGAALRAVDAEETRITNSTWMFRLLVSQGSPASYAG